MVTEIEQKQKAHIILHIGGGVLMVAALIIFYIAYLLFWPERVLDVRSVKVEPKTVYAGDTITLLLTYCKYKDMDAHVDVYFEGKVLLFSLAGLPRLPHGCRTNYPLAVVVPASSPSGMMHLRVEHSYRVNAIKNIIVTYRSDDFEVRQNPVLHP